MANGLPLFTCNPTDFEGIPGLDLRAVPHPGMDQP
jgi:tRNA(fMet)-specific endonuclease VapC